jgi:hypothetical protein
MTTCARHAHIAGQNQPRKHITSNIEMEQIINFAKMLGIDLLLLVVGIVTYYAFKKGKN